MSLGSISAAQRLKRRKKKSFRVEKSRTEVTAMTPDLVPGAGYMDGGTALV